jgi:hypothetical protein
MPRQESDVARPKQSEPSLDLDRRQLLAATAAVTAAGIVPNAEAVGTTNSAQAVNGAKISLSETPALNVCASTARKIEQVAERNRIREEAALPLLSISKELRKIKNAEIAAEFEEFAAVHRRAVWDEVLGPMRETRGEPNWRPTRLMEGFAFQAQVSKILRKRFEVSETSPNAGSLRQVYLRFVASYETLNFPRQNIFLHGYLA